MTTANSKTPGSVKCLMSRADVIAEQIVSIDVVGFGRAATGV
jgi:hypothetical protein